MENSQHTKPDVDRAVLQDATLVVRAGMTSAEQGQSFMPGPVFAAAFHAAGEPSAVPYTYGRYHNPTWTAYERALGDLEGGSALVFGSGMAAVMAVLGSVLRPGDVIVMPSDSYYTARVLVDSYFANLGVEVRRAPTAGGAQLEHLSGARLVWLESPTNPGLDVCDLPRLIRAAHDVGALVAVDNTTATPLGQRPLSLGADFSVASDTKALTGHADLVLGHVAVRDLTWLQQVRAWRTQTGSIAGPMEVWLALRSLATLDVRLERQCANALGMASYLASSPKVEGVRYPGLPTDPAHALACAQMQRFGTVVTFTLPTQQSAERFLAASLLITEATSFGGVYTTAERRARWGGDMVPQGFIRLSAGCEALADLLPDIEKALHRAVT
ncbi:MAG: cystathionine gamma-lyase [Gemmatimonadales bacterium]